jgi:hypothetical protein
MPALRDLQARFASALLSGDMTEIAPWIAAGPIANGPIAAADRVKIHRNTMLYAVAGALRLTYPATLALVGAAFFEQTALDFAREHPPRSALLTEYGGAFAQFLERAPALAELPYLPDVARLEWAIDRAARAPHFDEAPPCASVRLPGLTLALAPSLRLVETGFAAEAIRRAALDADEAALAAIDPGPVAGTVAVWRHGDGATAASLGPVAAIFLRRLLGGDDVEGSLAAALSFDPAADPTAIIGTEILAAGFARLTPATDPEVALGAPS